MAPKKNQKMSLGTFLQDENYGSWADEMEDMPLPSSDSRPSYGSDRRNFSSNAPSGDRFSERRDAYPPREQLPLPTQPPYTAHIANLSFDATQGDVNDFFRECQVTNVRIVEDRLDHKPKGFGYVEFGTLEGLKSALALSGNTLAGRQVRVSVAEPPKERQDARDLSDWSRKGPLPDLPQNQRRASDRPNFAGKNFDNVSDAGSERPNRRGFEQGDGKNRDFSNWERKGPLSPVTPAPTSLREGGRQHSKDAQGGFRKNSPAWGEGRSQDGGSRPPRREYTEKPVVERQPTASEMDNQWRARMRPDAPPKAPTPEASEPSSPAPPAAPALAVRPKLNLQKRTVSEAEPLSSPAATDSKASPFGAARPVDTAAKEKEVEEKRQLALRQRKEAEEKSRAEKAEEKRLAKEKTDAEKAKDPASKDAKDPSSTEDNEEENTQPTPKFDVLRRAEDNDMVAQEANDDEGEATPPVDEKAVKPKEVVRNPGNSRANGSWRGGPQSPAAAPDNSTAAALEEDGWSTVSKPTKQRNNRRNMPSRALAS